jgi:hypothetical protein
MEERILSVITLTGTRLAAPLTSVCTPPLNCPSIVTALTAVTSEGPCLPPYFNGVWWADGFYSPGICPSGYTVGCGTTTGVFNSELVMPFETVGLCVPR